MDNLEEMDEFLEKYNLQKLNQEETENLNRPITSMAIKSVIKYLHDEDNHNGVITHLEPDILDCEVKWALESITKQC